MAITGAIITTVGTVASIDAQRDQQKEAEIQRRSQRAVEVSKASREKRAQIRERRIKQARLAVAAEATGTAGSSALAGAQGVLSTQFATNTGFGAQLQQARDVIGASQVRSARAGLRGSIASSVAGIGSNIFSAYGGFENIFGDENIDPADGV